MAPRSLPAHTWRLITELKAEYAALTRRVIVAIVYVKVGRLPSNYTVCKILNAASGVPSRAP
jgi:hypothetical protein